MADTLCGVCGLEDDPVLLTSCFRCTVTFHLNPYSNRPGRDCGDAILGEEELGVYYYCGPCLVLINTETLDSERRASPPPPPAPAPRRPAEGARRRFRRVDP